MKLNQFIDATYLKTPSQAKISEEESKKIVLDLLQEAIDYNYKLVMIRANYISLAKEILSKSKTVVGTVIDFPKGDSTLTEKIKEAQKAIDLGADELDFVVNYKAFKKGNSSKLQEEVLHCTKLCLENNRVAKYIIEVAALTNQEISTISKLIKNVILENFGLENTKNVFVKSSTGFYNAKEGKPNGATLETMKLIAENAKPLQIKAAGGVRDMETAMKMISLGVNRIGTSSPKQMIINN